MRLFIAINFDNTIKQYLKEVQSRLKMISKKGNFSHDTNLHLTIVFIGEVEPNKVGQIQQAMDAIDATEFELSMGGVGRFKGNLGDTIWSRVDKNNTLVSIYNQLCSHLKENGFDIQNRDYKPHITLARNVMLTGDLGIISSPNIKTNINRISLMKSERIEGRLTYTEIYVKELA